MCDGQSKACATTAEDSVQCGRGQKWCHCQGGLDVCTNVNKKTVVHFNFALVHACVCMCVFLVRVPSPAPGVCLHWLIVPA